MSYPGRMATMVVDHGAIAGAIGTAELELAERLTIGDLVHPDRVLRGAGG